MAVTLRFREEGTYGRHRTIAALIENEPEPYTVYEGVAKCKRGDKPDRAVGRKLALGRAVMAWRRASFDRACLAADAFVPPQQFFDEMRAATRQIYADYFRIYEPDTVRGRAERARWRDAQMDWPRPSTAHPIPADPLKAASEAWTDFAEKTYGDISQSV